MKKLHNYILSLAVALVATGCCQQQKAKYVFYFIGDGMGFDCISIAETYLAQAEEGHNGMGLLSFSTFPVLGASATYSADSQVTDSAAGGTALATGTKVNNGAIAITPDGDTLTSIAYKAHDAGMKVGIVATVGIDHATPASFYAHNVYRGNYAEISSEVGATGFEFFGGGDFIGGEDWIAPAEEAGYTFAFGKNDYNEKKAAEKLIYFQRKDYDKSRTEVVDYVTKHRDNNPDDICLADLVEAAVNHLDNPNGFFIMAEGSKIDYAAHANSLDGLIFETIDLSDAVAVALDFYKKHPKNTLIVVTADHETGGPSCKSPNLGNIRETLKPLDKTSANYLNDEHEAAEETSEYGIAWTTKGHSGERVPIFAIGAGSEKFAGSMENIDIPRKICEAMGIEF
ncbi:MAG: alkaline phosphatase [Bacteroidales bacterium]|nr:alkaline phosphatase [Bacteroidales bacterium]